MIPRISYVLILGAVAFALLPAAAAQGLLDRLPQQPYFPRALAERHEIQCDPEGAHWPEQISATRWDTPVLDRSRADWYGAHLRAAQELSLSQPAAGGPANSSTTVRFTWLRSFHAPVIVRVDENTGGEFQLTAVLLSGRGGYDPGGIAERRVRMLDAREAAALRRSLRDIDVFEIAPVGCGGGADGAEWLIEARDAGQYHLARRWSPRGGAVRELGMLLLSFTRWDLEPVY